jgi:hypothetical protein
MFKYLKEEKLSSAVKEEEKSQILFLTNLGTTPTLHFHKFCFIVYQCRRGETTCAMGWLKWGPN